MQHTSQDSKSTKVWDIWVRLFHWLLVLSILAAALTGFLADATWIRLHVAGGLAAAALVLARIVWGFTGTTHARFSNFVPRPAEVIDHLRGRGHRHLGHNPLGALMVLALFAAIFVLALTGLAVLGGLLRTGPLAADLGTNTGLAARELHEVIAFGLLGLVGFHIVGVVFESLRSRENLARSMITGRKEMRPGDAQTREIPVNLVLATVALSVAAFVLIASNTAMSTRPVSGMPVTPVAKLVSDECGACHMVYHPSLLPSASWSQLMANLTDHFGEDATLDAASTAEIEAWLTSNSAETAETLPAKAFSKVAPDAPFTLSRTPFWKRVHSDLPDTLFKSPKIGSRSNCAACHRDAADGWFSPFSIEIPKETKS